MEVLETVLVRKLQGARCGCPQNTCFNPLVGVRGK